MRPIQEHALANALAAAGLAALLCLAQAPARAAPQVVASIKPVHGLVAGVMAGVGEPLLLVKGAGSPHGYRLRPSEARALNRADLVFWIGAALETFLEKHLKSLPESVTRIALAEADGVILLPTREAGAWRRPAHDDDQDRQARDDQVLGPHDQDPHLWLDPRNATAIVRGAVAALSDVDPANAARYGANGAGMIGQIDALDRELAARLAPLRGRPFVVFHDAFQYFEKRYGLDGAGSITVSPEKRPGARRLREIRRRIDALGAICVFSEPQFQPALIDAVVRDTAAKTALLDPLGLALTPGPEAYFALMRDLATAFTACLAPES